MGNIMGDIIGKVVGNVMGSVMGNVMSNGMGNVVETCLTMTEKEMGSQLNLMKTSERVCWL